MERRGARYYYQGPAVVPYRIRLVTPKYDNRDAMCGFNYEIVDSMFTLRWARHRLKEWCRWMGGDATVEIVDRYGNTVYDYPAYVPQVAQTSNDEFPF